MKTTTHNSTTTLEFDDTSGRWCIAGRDLHCGDCFWLYPDRFNLPPIEVRIEHASDGWYLLTPYGITRPSNRKAGFQP